MSYRQRASLRESGVEYLGAIPSDWDAVRLKRVASTVAGGTPDTDNPLYWSDDVADIGWVAIGDMSGRMTVPAVNRRLTAEGILSKRLTPHGVGTILFAMYASVGEFSRLEFEATWNQAILGVIPDLKRISPEFLYFALVEVRHRLPFLYRSNTQNNLNAEQVNNLDLALPPLNEQKQISDFLDRETGQIDNLIAEQEGLIAALAERRKSVISHAVTKGLDPAAELKDSGVEWIGSAPNHWEIKRLKHSIESCKNGVWGEDPDGGEDDVRCIRVADFDRAIHGVGDGSATLRKVSASDRASRTVHRGDLLIEKSGGTESNPVGFVVLYDSDVPAVCSNFVGRIALAGGMDSKFWSYVHAASYSTLLTQKSVKKTTGIQNLDQLNYFNERAPFPNLREQEQIAEYLDAKTQQIDALVDEAKELVSLLRERRSALISAAVTGKIDVTANIAKTTNGASHG